MKLLFSSIFIILYACKPASIQNRAPGSHGEKISLNRCGCSFEHAPVCGSDGLTYTNQCIAKCHGVSAFSPKACTCNSQSGKICGRTPRGPAQEKSSYRTYQNECEMILDGASFKSLGDCR